MKLWYMHIVHIMYWFADTLLQACSASGDPNHTRMRNPHIDLKYLAGKVRSFSCSGMAQENATSESEYDEESLLDIEVLRKEGAASSTSLATLAADSSAEGVSQTYYSTLTRRNHTTSKPSNGEGNTVDNRNGCCHSTPLQGSACENWLLKDYFSRIPPSVVGYTNFKLTSTDIYNRSTPWSRCIISMPKHYSLYHHMHFLYCRLLLYPMQDKLALSRMLHMFQHKDQLAAGHYWKLLLHTSLPWKDCWTLM